jgi:hypothetical protein
MQNQKTFGRRPQARRETPMPLRPAAAAPLPWTRDTGPALADLPPPDRHDDVDAELEQWKATRKVHKRSFREPWRSVSIAASVGFALSSWLLPDSVANVAEVVTTALGLASLIAGFRKPRAAPAASVEAAPKS